MNVAVVCEVRDKKSLVEWHVPPKLVYFALFI